MRISLKTKDIPEFATEMDPITDDELEMNASNCSILSFNCSISPLWPVGGWNSGLVASA